MNKKELITKISDKLNISPFVVNDVVCTMINEIISKMESGEDVFIRNFGTFTTKNQKTKKGYDFSCGETLDIPEKRVPYIKFSKGLKDWIDSTKDNLK